MLSFLMENAATIVVAALVLVIAAAALAAVLRTRRTCGACAFCAQRKHCGKIDENCSMKGQR